MEQSISVYFSLHVTLHHLFYRHFITIFGTVHASLGSLWPQEVIQKKGGRENSNSNDECQQLSKQQAEPIEGKLNLN